MDHHNNTRVFGKYVDNTGIRTNENKSKATFDNYSEFFDSPVQISTDILNGSQTFSLLASSTIDQNDASFSGTNNYPVFNQESDNAVSDWERSPSLLAKDSNGRTSSASTENTSLFGTGSIFAKYSDRIFRCMRNTAGLTHSAFRETLCKDFPTELNNIMWNITPETLPDKFHSFIRTHTMSSWKAFVFKSEYWNNLCTNLNEPAHVSRMVDLVTNVIPKNDDIAHNFWGVIEVNEYGVPHAHIMFKSNQRIDAFRRTINAHLEKTNQTNHIECVKSQTVKSLEGLMKYFLKQPIAVIIGNYTFLHPVLAILENTEMQWQENRPKKIPADVTHVLDLMRTHCVYSLEDIMRKCPSEIEHLLGRPNLNSLIQTCALFLNVAADTEQLQKKILVNATPTLINRHHIDAFLNYQNIDPVQFGKDFHKFIWRQHPKRNTFVLQGPPNTGKSSFIRPLTELFRWGQILQAHQFMFQNCLRKELVLWEEPLISKDFSDKCKLLFEGSQQMVEVKSNAPQLLERTPIIITTNKDIWYYASADQEAFKARIYHYFFTTAFSDVNSPDRIDQCTITNSCNSEDNRNSSTTCGSTPTSDSRVRRQLSFLNCYSGKQCNTTITDNNINNDSDNNRNCNTPILGSNNDLGTCSTIIEDEQRSDVSGSSGDDQHSVTDGASGSCFVNAIRQCSVHGSSVSYSSRDLSDLQSQPFECTCQFQWAPKRKRRHNRSDLGTHRTRTVHDNSGSTGRLSPTNAHVDSTDHTKRRKDQNLHSQSTTPPKQPLDWTPDQRINKSHWIDWLAYWIKIYQQ
uniref:Nonstructural protein n=1 Tax=Luscinia cyane Ichthamaparvovirus TaxID=2794553 RepID=A0A8A4XDV8_9VIRU|nr:MAG: nonstructural protein [Luscinia cyane Ichthamaparvovirus]